MQDIETLIIKGGFKLKEWIFSRDSSNGKKSIPNESNVATEKESFGTRSKTICAFQQSLRTFTRNFSNIDFFLKILPLKAHELAMPKR